MAKIDLIKEAVSTISKPSAGVAKTFQDRNMGQRASHPVKVITVIGPDGATAWSATIVVATAPDGRGWSPVTKTYTISNATPGLVDAMSTPCDNWGAWITAYSGDASGTGANGFKGINVMVEG